MVKINPGEAIYDDNKNSSSKKTEQAPKFNNSALEGYGGSFNSWDGLGIERTEPKEDKDVPDVDAPPKNAPNVKNTTMPTDTGIPNVNPVNEPKVDKTDTKTTKDVPDVDAPPKNAPNVKNTTMPTDTGIPNVNPVKNESEKKGLTLEQVKEARNDGKLVAEFLGGHTNRLEQEHVKEIILEKVNPENIIEFLRGYMQNKSITTDRLFEQLESEWGFEEAQNLMRKLAGDLRAYCEKHHDRYRASEIALILMENGFSREDAERLDDLAGFHEKNKETPVIPGFGALGLGYTIINEALE